jgi:hypothetical protein
MTNAGIVAALKAFAILVAKLAGHIGVAKFILVIYIRLAMVLEIPASPFYAIVKPTPLCFSEFGRHEIPSTVVAISRGRGALLGRILGVHCSCGT